MYLSNLSLLLFFLAPHGAYTKPTNETCNLKPESYVENALKQYQNFKGEFKYVQAFFENETNIQAYVDASTVKPSTTISSNGNLKVRNEFQEFNLAKALSEMDSKYCLKRSDGIPDSLKENKLINELQMIGLEVEIKSQSYTF